MSIELTNLRDASRELDYRQRVHNDTVSNPSQAKNDLLATTNRKLKRAKAEFDRAITACHESGIDYSSVGLPRAVAVRAE